MRIERVGRIKVETELVDLAYRRLEVKDTKLVIVEFQLKRSIAPEEAKDVAELLAEFVRSFVKPAENEIVAISGRGPIYLYMIAQHKLQHIVAGIGQFDPKLNGVVITSVHNYELEQKGYREGQVVKLPEEMKAELTQA